MKMRIKLAVLCSTFLLGSCVPQGAIAPPNTQITVYVNSGQDDDTPAYSTAVVEQEHPHQQNRPDVDVTKCVKPDPKTYRLPAIPDISDLDDNAHDAIRDRLIDYIRVLRKELRSVTCLSAVPSPP